MEDYLPPRKIKNREHIVQVTAVKFEDLKGISSSDQTVVFPNISSRRNRNIIVMENSDAGPVLVVAIRSRMKKHLLRGFIEMHDTDNEFSKELIEDIKARRLKYQIAPRGNH